MRFEDYLFHYHNLTPADIEISDVPGCWYVKSLCPGGEKCRHAFRGVLGHCEGGTRLTISYSEHGKRDSKGRFVRPLREWEQQKQQASAA